MSWYHVDKTLLPLKGIYFTFFAAMGNLIPFLSVYMKQLGLTSTETGIIYGVMPFIAFFVRPILGIIADKTRKHKLSLIICILFTGVCHCLLLLVPSQTQACDGTSRRSNYRISQCLNEETTLHRNCNETFHQSLDSLQMNSSYSTCYSITDITMAYRSIGDNEDGNICLDRCSITMDRLQKITCLTQSELKARQDELKICVNQKSECQFHITDSYYEQVIIPGQSVTEYSDVMLYNHSHSSNDLEVELDQLGSQNMSLCHRICNTELNSTLACSPPTSLQETFWLTFVIFLFCNIFYSPVGSLLDAIVYDKLGTRRSEWGKQRLWGTIGNALFAVASSITMDVFSKSEAGINYEISFYIFFTLSIVSCIITFFLKISDSIRCTQMMTNIALLLKYPKIVIFLSLITCFGIMNAVIQTFLFWYLQELGSSQLILGLCVLANCLPEMVAFFCSGYVIGRIGHVKCLYIASLGYVVRFFGYSFITNPWYVLLIEPLHCITFGLMYAAASSYASIIAPEGMSATIQGLLGGLYAGFGKGLGSLVTGKLFDSTTGLGPVWTFRFYGFFGLTVLIMYVLANELPCHTANTTSHVVYIDGKETKDTNEPTVKDKLTEPVVEFISEGDKDNND